MRLQQFKGVLLAAVVAVGVIKSGEYTFAGDEKYLEYEEDNENGGIMITGVKDKNIESITVPDAIDGKPVTSIGYQAFADCFELENIELNDGLLKIGSNAFEYTGIKSIEIPESVKFLGSQAFLCCYQLESIEINGPLGDDPHDSAWAMNKSEDYLLYDFLGLNSLKTISIKDYDSNYLSSKDGVLFNKDGSMLIKYPGKHEDTKYVIPDGVETICNYAFGYSYDLTEVTIPDSVTSIGMNAFIDCKSLKSVTIPESVTSIGDLALGCEVVLSFEDDGVGGSVDNSYITRIDGFTIKGKKDSAAYKYAMDYKFIFVDIDTGETIIPEYDDEEEITDDVIEDETSDDVMTLENATATVNPASGSTDGRAFMMVFAVMAVAAGASVFTLKMRRE